MKQFEVTFIVDPVLSGDEIKATAQTYVDLISKEASKVVYVDEMGLRQLAYPINRRSSGVYYCVEFQIETGVFIANLELAFRRDERIMRFLTVSLNKYGVKYNDDKRNGLIGKHKKKAADGPAATKKEAPKKDAPVAKKETPAPAAAKKEAPAAPVAAVKEAPAAKATATEEEE